MNKLYSNFSFIVGFMVFIVFWNMTFGEKPTRYLLILILTGMVLTNSNKFKSLLGSKTASIKPGVSEEGIMNTPQTGGTARA